MSKKAANLRNKYIRPPLRGVPLSGRYYQGGLDALPSESQRMFDLEHFIHKVRKYRHYQQRVKLPKSTLDFVGDLHQRLSHFGVFKAEDDTRITEFKIRNIKQQINDDKQERKEENAKFRNILDKIKRQNEMIN